VPTDRFGAAPAAAASAHECTRVPDAVRRRTGSPSRRSRHLLSQYDRRQNRDTPMPTSVREPLVEVERPGRILLRWTEQRGDDVGLGSRRRIWEYCGPGRRGRAGDADELLGVTVVPEVAGLEGQPMRAVASSIGGGRCSIHPVEWLDTVAGHPGEQDYVPVLLPRTAVVCRPCQGGVFPPEPLSYP
jgi:hypothetical protein